MSISSTQKLSDLKGYIALVETVEDVDEILVGLSTHNLFISDILWLPVEVEADLYLRQKGISPISITDLLTVDDRKRIFLDAFEWSKIWLDETPLKKEEITFKAGLLLSELVLIHIYYFFDDLFYLVNLLENMIKQIQPRTLIVSSNRPEMVAGIDHTKENYLYRITKIMAYKYSVDLLEIDGFQTSTIEYTSIDPCNKDVGRDVENYSEMLFKKLSLNNKGRPNSLLDKHTMRRLDGKRILVYGGGLSSPYWRLEPLCHILETNTNCEVIPLYYSKDEVDEKKPGIFLSCNRIEKRNSPAFLEREEKINSFLKKMSFFKKIIYRGVDLNILFDKKLYWILKEYLPEYWLDCLVLKEELEKTHIDLLIGAHPIPFEIAPIHMCEDANIPTLLIPHGAQFCQYSASDETKSMFNLNSPFIFSHVSVVGEYTRKKLIECGVKESRVRSTGSLDPLKIRKITTWFKSTYSLSRMLSFRKGKIVYFLGRAARNFHMSYINISFSEMMLSICDVIRLANELNYQLLIKPHPDFVNAGTWIRSWAPEGDYRIIDDQGANSYLLWIADIVIGSKSSILMEALDYDIPTIIFEHEKRELHYFEDLACPLDEFKANKEKPFLRANGFDELLYTCRTIKNDREFIKYFREKSKSADPWVHHNRDNKQVDRNLKFMADIIDDHQKEAYLSATS